VYSRRCAAEPGRARRGACAATSRCRRRYGRRGGKIDLAGEFGNDDAGGRIGCLADAVGTFVQDLVAADNGNEMGSVVSEMAWKLRAWISRSIAHREQEIFHCRGPFRQLCSTGETVLVESRMTGLCRSANGYSASDVGLQSG
jgi:hypothetical protein